MSKVVYFSEHERDAVDLCNEAAAMGYEQVCIVGIKNGKVYINSSLASDVLTELGMLEAAKDHILKNWE